MVKELKLLDPFLNLTFIVSYMGRIEYPYRTLTYLFDRYVKELVTRN